MTAAAKAEELVRFAAWLGGATGTVKAQKCKAYEVLGARQIENGWSKIEEAWKGRAGAPTYHALKEAADARGIRPALAPIDKKAVSALLISYRTMLESPDPEFHRGALEMVRDALGDYGLEVDLPWEQD